VGICNERVESIDRERHQHATSSQFWVKLNPRHAAITSNDDHIFRIDDCLVVNAEDGRPARRRMFLATKSFNSLGDPCRHPLLVLCHLLCFDATNRRDEINHRILTLPPTTADVRVGDASISFGRFVCLTFGNGIAFTQSVSSTSSILTYRLRSC